MIKIAETKKYVSDFYNPKFQIKTIPRLEIHNELIVRKNNVARNYYNMRLAFLNLPEYQFHSDVCFYHFNSFSKFQITQLFQFSILKIALVN
jgi:hypothetical protein